ncbi:MAG: hypothetical protein AB7O38_18145 [Pirellulaceae bacterium]
MDIERETLLVGMSLVVQFIGIVGVVVARLCQRHAKGWSAGLVIACVVTVGILSLGTMETCESGWLIFATTLPLMAVGATLDTRKSSTRAAF